MQDQNQKATKARWSDGHLTESGKFTGCFVNPTGIPILTDLQHKNFIAVPRLCKPPFGQAAEDQGSCR
eukprot:9332636-Prorocentrum_lima.AAC.1